MKTKVCDICHKVENQCEYKLKAKFKLKRFDWDSQGGSWYRFDVCDECIKKLIRMVEKGVKR